MVTAFTVFNSANAEMPKIDEITLAFCEYSAQRHIITQTPQPTSSSSYGWLAWWGRDLNIFNDALFLKKTGMTKETFLQRFGEIEQRIAAIKECKAWAKKAMQ